MNEVALKPEEIDSLRTKAMGSLYFFAKGILGFDWLVPQIHKPICQLLESSETNIRIVLPRGWLKSTVCTIAYPVWRACKDPNVRILIAQNTITNACKKLASIRAIFEKNPFIRLLFPGLVPDTRAKDVVWRSDALRLNRSAIHAENTIEAAGTKTKATSRHYDEIIEDDTVSPDLDDFTANNVLPSTEDIEQAIGWHRNAVPLLVDIKRSRQIIVGTRWFERDLIQWSRDNEPHYKEIQRAVKETNGLPDDKGTLSWPERFDEEVLSKLKASMGPYLYSCLYLNTPVRSDDMIFQPQWIQYYDTMPHSLIYTTSVDPATDPDEVQSEDPDYSVVLTTGKDTRTGYVYVAEYTRERMTPSELIAAIFNHVRLYSPISVKIEKVAYQNTILHWARERMRKENLFFYIEGVTHGNTAKRAKIMGLQPVFSNKAILLAKHMTELVSELLAFPFGNHDDIIDALALQLQGWQLSDIKAEKEADEELERNPLSFRSALKELQSRHSRGHLPAGDMLDKRFTRQLSSRR